jgi:hypothetical protein
MATHTHDRSGTLLDAGCWAEHDDGSLLLVGRSEGEWVDYWLFDLAGTPPTIRRYALPKAKFEKVFADKGDFLWTWHAKTPFPWDRLTRAINVPWWRNTPLAKVA